MIRMASAFATVFLRLFQPQNLTRPSTPWPP
jgi:hypothetical protein